MALIAKTLALFPGSWLRKAAALQWRIPAARRIYQLVASSMRDVDGVIAKGSGKGLRFNPGRANAGYLLGTSEPSVQAAIRALAREGSTVWDVGANVGFFSVIAARCVGPRGAVIAFEPLPSNAERIRGNAALNGFGTVSVREEALSELDGTSRFLVSAEAEWGRLPLDEQAPSVAEQLEEIAVTVRSMDSLRVAGEVPRPDLIKMDIEGAEAAALRGAKATLQTERPILLIELHGTNREVAAVLREARYRPFVIGRSGSIDDAPWNAYVVAAPEELDDLVAACAPFGSPRFSAR